MQNKEINEEIIYLKSNISWNISHLHYHDYSFDTNAMDTIFLSFPKQAISLCYVLVFVRHYTYAGRITVTSHVRVCISFHRPLVCLFKAVIGPPPKTPSKLCIIGP